MADFQQAPAVTTVHDLRHLDDQQRRAHLEQWTATYPVSLVLPSLYSELSGDALPTIIDELAEVTYLREVIVGIDGADAAEFDRAKAYFERLPQHHRLLWNDGPAMRELDADLAKMGLAALHPGKGRNVWYCLGYFLASDRSKGVVMHDCDITTYSRTMLDRLVYPLAHPDLNIKVAKGFYARTDGEKMNGRVSRLFMAPLLAALRDVVTDPLATEYLTYLAGFRYVLAGEQAMGADVVVDMEMPCDWGLEVGIVSDAHRRLDPLRICQVEISDRYDHKHQELVSPAGGLEGMARDIVAAVVRTLTSMGIDLSLKDVAKLTKRYALRAEGMVDSYRVDALANGLNYDIDREMTAIHVFGRAVSRLGDIEEVSPVIPSWATVQRAMPEVFERLDKIVEADNA